jgi:hypothetical protein
MDTMTISENKPPVTDYGWGMEELSAFEAASEEIKAIISDYEMQQGCFYRSRAFS